MNMLLVLMSVLAASHAFAGNAEIRDCVARSKSDGSNIYAIAQQSSGVKNVDLVRQCVETVRHQDGLIMPDTAVACEGVRNVTELRECIAYAHLEGMSDTAAAKL
jgi:hypothetical protein